MSTLARYVGGRILVRFILITLTFSVFVASVDAMERADKILRLHDQNHLAVLRYVALRLPEFALEVTPICALLAALLALGDLMRHRELVASWNMGVSPAMLMAGLLPVGALLALGQATLEQAVVPRTGPALIDMGVYDERAGLLTGDTDGPLWMRDGNELIRVVANPDRSIGPVSILRLDDQGLLVGRLDARRLTAGPDGWRLRGVVERNIEPPTIQHLEELPWPGRVSPRYLRLLAMDARSLAFPDLLRVLSAGKTGSRPRALYVTWAIHSVIGPLAPVLMIMLAVALAQRFERTGGLARLLITGTVLGFGYFILDQAALALGEAGAIPPWLAAVGASAGLACLIAWLVHAPQSSTLRRGLPGPSAVRSPVG